MSEVLLVVLGSVLGAGGAVGGSVFVDRQQIRRDARIRIHRGLLPDLIDNALARWPGAITKRQIDDLYREGVLAGRDEQRLALRAVEIHSERISDPTGRDPNGNLVQTRAEAIEWETSNQALLNVLLELEKLLKDKIAGGSRRQPPLGRRRPAPHSHEGSATV